MVNRKTIYRTIDSIHGYTFISNSLLKNMDLSDELIAFMVRMIALPSDWEFNLQWAQIYFKKTPEQLKAIIAEAKKAGYVKTVSNYNNKGQKIGKINLFTDTPFVFEQGGQDEY